MTGSDVMVALPWVIFGIGLLILVISLLWRTSRFRARRRGNDR